MQEKVLLGRGKQMHEIPQAMWEGHLHQIPDHSRERLSFMTEQHHRVRYYAVRELVGLMKPLTPESISAALKLPLERVHVILEELEQKLFFLVRDEQGNVAWAYPVTVEPTPHRLRFSSGERLYAA
jgi:hypothetical protein